MIYVIATLKLKPGTREKLLEPARVCIEETRKEEGCIAYDLLGSITDDDTMIFVEKWQSRADLTAHSRTSHIAAWREAGAPYIQSRSIEIVHPDQVEHH